MVGHTVTQSQSQSHSSANLNKEGNLFSCFKMVGHTVTLLGPFEVTWDTFSFIQKGRSHSHTVTLLGHFEDRREFISSLQNRRSHSHTA
jgi:MFS-type transporter involved in bile tolerance (Atg22 family)